MLRLPASPGPTNLLSPQQLQHSCNVHAATLPDTHLPHKGVEHALIAEACQHLGSHHLHAIVQCFVDCRWV